MEFTFTIETSNAAFDPDPGPEVARLLRETADRIGLLDQQDSATWRATAGTVRDTNGNTVGRWKLTP